MKGGVIRRTQGLRFNMTPLIDVVFLLIIFFLAASHLARSEERDAVRLPEATTAQQQPSRSRQLVITVTAQQEYRVGGNPLPLPAIEERIRAGLAADPDFEVRIRTDRDLPYSLIEPLIVTCARAGAQKVGFAAMPR